MTATARIISARAAIRRSRTPNAIKAAQLLEAQASKQRRLAEFEATAPERAARKAFGLAVAARRKSLKLKQDGLAIAMGVSVAHICNMEKGLNWPSIPAYEKLCRALQVGAPPLMK